MTSYLKNYLGYQLTPEEMEDIPYAWGELCSHITFKTVQVGTIGGTLSGALVAAIKKDPSFQTRITRYGTRGVLGGIVLGPVLTMAVVKAKHIDEEGLRDRCYRLRHNRSQVRVDRACDAGFLTGASISLLAGTGIMYGAVLGCTAGVLTTAVLNIKGVFDK